MRRVALLSGLLLTLPVLTRASEDVGTASASLFEPAAARMMLKLDVSGGGSVLLCLPPRHGERTQAAAEALERAIRRKLDQAAEPLVLDFCVNAEIPSLLAWRGLVREATFDLQPLREVFEPLGVRSLELGILHPPAPYSSHAPSSTSVLAGRAQPQRGSLSLDLGESSGLVSIRFGYGWLDVGRALWPIVALSLLPPLVTLFLRRRLLRSALPPAVAWFRLEHVVSWMGLALMVLLIAIAFSWELVALLHFTLGGWGLSGMLFAMMGLLVTAEIASHLLCQAAAYPVLQRVGATDWSRADLIRCAFWSHAFNSVPWMLGAFGAFLLWKGADVRSGLIALAAAWASRLWLARRVQRAAELVPHSLSTGELRDRVFELAEKAGIRVRNLSVLPAGKGRAVNAFAAQGDRLILSDALVRALDKRELDAVVAHELAHLRLGHTNAGWLGGLLPGAMLVGVLVVGGWNWWIAGGLLLLPLLGGAVAGAISRRRERAADAAAIEMTKDPEALIRSLARITCLSAQPMSWSRWDGSLLSHPTTRERAGTIARAAGIPADRLEQLLSEPPCEPLESYPLPPDSHERLFSSAFRTDAFVSLFWSGLVLASLPPVLAAWLAHGQGWGWQATTLALAAAAIAASGLGLFMPALSWRRRFRLLGRQLAARLRFEGLEVRAEEGVPIGLAPDAEVREYEGFSIWDVGFLMFSGDRLCYAGEQARFALAREQVLSVHAAAGPARLFKPWRRVWIEWQAETSSGTLQLVLLDELSRRGNDRRSELLAGRIQDWLARSPIELPAPPLLEELGPPRLGAVTSAAPGDGLRLQDHLMALLLPLGAAVVLGLLAGLPSDPGQPGSIGAAALAAGLGRLALLLPGWLPRRRRGLSRAGGS
jgi:heat shock protein HtpX